MTRKKSPAKFREEIIGDWISWSGGICPTDVNSPVEYMIRAMKDEFRCEKAGWLRWAHSANESLSRNDIVAWRPSVSDA